MRYFKLALVLLLLLCVALVAGQDAETIVVRSIGNLSTFNHVLSSDGASFHGFSFLWPKPYEIDAATSAPVPGLTSWEISDDGLTYTFHIREDANWSDGTPITSHDMKFVIDAIKSQEVESVQEGDVQAVEEVRIVDDKTYEVVLSELDCTSFSQLGGVRFLPSHLFAADFSDFEENMVTTEPLGISGGPYILDAWEPGAYQSFRANPDWWGGDVGIPYIINRTLPDQVVSMQSFQAGELDYTYLHGDLFDQLADTSNFQWEVFPQMSVKFFALNWVDPEHPAPAYDEDGNPVEQVPHPIFTDIAVRKAVAMGYSKSDILATMGGDLGGTPLIGPVNPGIGWAYNQDLQPYPYDPEGAMQLLEDAGWVDSDGDGVREKDGQRLEFTISYNGVVLKMFETHALVAQDQLSDIGFDVSLETVEWSNYISEIYRGQMYDATSMSNSGGTGGAPDPNDFMTLIDSREDRPGSGNNLASYVNPEVDALLDQARTVAGCSTDERGAIYREIQRILHEDVAYDWSFVPNIWQTANKRVQGFEPAAFWVFYGYTADIHNWTLEG